MINTVKIIVFAGVSDGGTDKMMLIQENENDDTRIPKIIITKFSELQNGKIKRPNIKGTIEKIEPNRNEAQTSPNRIVLIEIGQVINLSRVFCLVSHGKTLGPCSPLSSAGRIAINPEII